MCFLQAPGFFFKPANKRRVVTNTFFPFILINNKLQLFVLSFFCMKTSGSITQVATQDFPPKTSYVCCISHWLTWRGRECRVGCSKWAKFFSSMGSQIFLPMGWKFKQKWLIKNKNTVKKPLIVIRTMSECKSLGVIESVRINGVSILEKKANCP